MIKASWTYEELTRLVINIVSESNHVGSEASRATDQELNPDPLVMGAMMFWFRITLQGLDPDLMQERHKCQLH